MRRPAEKSHTVYFDIDALVVDTNKPVAEWQYTETAQQLLLGKDMIVKPSDGGDLFESFGQAIAKHADIVFVAPAHLDNPAGVAKLAVALERLLLAGELIDVDRNILFYTATDTTPHTPDSVVSDAMPAVDISWERYMSYKPDPEVTASISEDYPAHGKEKSIVITANGALGDAFKAAHAEVEDNGVIDEHYQQTVADFQYDMRKDVTRVANGRKGVEALHRFGVARERKQNAQLPPMSPIVIPGETPVAAEESKRPARHPG
ncbi:MAG: hypothetical protein P1U40_02245 [Coxiellaceae bacterium]|nr:hypothetical protein [Coxiellaceae bacterium]